MGMLWPNYETLTDEIARNTLEFIAKSIAYDKVIVALRLQGGKLGKMATRFPASTCRQKKGTIDVWTIVHDGGLLVLLAYLLHQHRVWRKSTIRIFCVINTIDLQDMGTALEEIKKELKAYLFRLRIEAEIHVINVNQNLDQFKSDWTIRKRNRSYREVHDDDGLSKMENNYSREGSYAGFGSEYEGVEGDIELLNFSKAMLQTKERSDSERDKFSYSTTENNNLRACIMKHSKSADLVLLNLPPPPKISWREPSSYLKLVDFLTFGLPRVIFVYGSGVEALHEE